MEKPIFYYYVLLYCSNNDLHILTGNLFNPNARGELCVKDIRHKFYVSRSTHSELLKAIISSDDNGWKTAQDLGYFCPGSSRASCLYDAGAARCIISTSSRPWSEVSSYSHYNHWCIDNNAWNHTNNFKRTFILRR